MKIWWENRHGSIFLRHLLAFNNFFLTHNFDPYPNDGQSWGNHYRPTSQLRYLRVMNCRWCGEFVPGWCTSPGFATGVGHRGVLWRHGHNINCWSQETEGLGFVQLISHIWCCVSNAILAMARHGLLSFKYRITVRYIMIYIYILYILHTDIFYIELLD